MAYTGSYQRQDIQPVASRSGVWEVIWKGYFFLLVVLNLAAPFVLPELYISISPHVIIDFVMTLISLIGLFGYAWKERIFTNTFWKAFFFVAIIALIIPGFIPLPTPIMEAIMKNPVRVMGILIPGFVAHLPMFIAIFLYGFRSKELWAMSKIN